MANTQRRAEYTDRNNNMFIPMNVEGGVYNEHFINTTKLIFIVLMIVSIVSIIIYLGHIHARLFAYIFYIGSWFIISMLITRYIVFEERFYYKMYLELKDNEVTTPALFWNIASIKDTDDGAIMTYSDAKIAAILKVERDTITGKNADFKETHYDAISDFYKELAAYKLSFIQMNIMEQAGKDPRLAELAKVVHKSDNENICKLMEMEVGHIKNITRRSLYEMDYFLIYTQDPSRIETLLQDITDAVYKLLDGAYSGYRILVSREIVELVKEQYGVNYFNATQASLYMFKKNAIEQVPPFDISGILWDNGTHQELTGQEVVKIKQVANKVISGEINSETIDLKQLIYRKRSEKTVGVNIDAINEKAEEFNKKQAEIQARAEQNKRNKKNRNNKQVEIEVTQQEIYGNTDIVDDADANDDEIIDI